MRADIQLLVAIVNNIFVNNLIPRAQSAIAMHANSSKLCTSCCANEKRTVIA